MTAVNNQVELAKYYQADSAKEINVPPSSDSNLTDKEKQNSPNPEEQTKPSCSINIQLVAIIIALIIVVGLLVFFIIYFKFLFQIKNDQKLDLIKLSSSSARCLDGTPASYYISQGGDPSKILVYFVGGGWCFDQTEDKTIQACYQRSLTGLGSSNNLPQTITLPNGIMSKDDNNYFQDWKKVYLHYCDGTGHQGYRKDPIQYKGTKLYFRGYTNTVERFEDIENRIGIFTKADKVVMSGSSAGGLAVMTWTNYLAGKMQKGKMFTLVDAGLFYDSMDMYTNKYAYKARLATMMKISNAQIDLPVPQCLANFPDSKENCMMPQNLYQYIKTPLFLVQSLYDFWSVSQIVGATCVLDSLKACGPGEMVQIEEQRKNVTKVMQKIAQNKANGVWGISCVKHSFLSLPEYADWNYRVSKNTGYTAVKAVAQWLQNPDLNNVHLDLNSWPDNQPCA